MNAPKTAPKKGPKRAPETSKQKMFSQEMHYQVYRIDQLAKHHDAIAQAAASTPDLIKRPLLQRFLEAYSGKRSNEFIKEASGKTAAEREKLLDGIRGVLHRAKTKVAAGADKPKKTAKAAEKKDKELERIDKLLGRELKGDEVNEWEKAIDTPFNIQSGKLDFKKIEKHYKTILLGQKVFGTHVMEMQKSYQSGMKDYVAHQKKYTSGWRTVAGTGDYVGRKLSSAWRIGTNLFRKKKNEKRDPLDKINKKIAKTRKMYKQKMERVKLVKSRIKARSEELKTGMGVYKGDIRKKLQALIKRGDWTKKKETEKKKQRDEFKAKRKLLSAGYSRAHAERLKIKAAQNSSSALTGQLKQKVQSTTAGQGVLSQRITAMKARIADMTRVYGKDDERVIKMRKLVLVPMMRASSRVAEAKSDRTKRLTDLEKRNHKLEVLNSDIYLQETTSAAAVAQLDLGVTKTNKRLAVLSSNRAQLHGMLQNVETAYGAVSQFKDNVSTNLDKMNKGNDKVMKGVNSQYESLKNVKATQPGLFKSLYNTAFIGKYGVMGALEVATQGITRVPAYFGAKLLGYDIEWKDTKNWHLFGAVNWTNEKLQNWLDSGGLLKYTDKDSAIATKIVLGGLNTGAGLVGGAANIVNGLVQFVKNPFEALEGLATILTDWKLAKQALKSVIHYNDWAEGRYNIATGRTAADVLALVFTAGNSAGANAVAQVGKAGKLARMAAYGKGFASEAGRSALGLGKGLVMLPKTLLVGAFNIGKTATRAIGAMTKGGFKSYWYGERLTANAAKAQEVLMETVAKAKTHPSYSKLTPETQTMLGALQKNGLDKFAKSGQLDILMERFAQEFRHSGFRARGLIDGLQGKLGKWVKADVKFQAGQRMLERRGLAVKESAELTAANDVVTSAQKAVDEATGAKRAVTEAEESLKTAKAERANIKESGKGEAKISADKAITEAETTLTTRQTALKELTKTNTIEKLETTLKDAQAKVEQIQTEALSPIKRADDLIKVIKENPPYTRREIGAAKNTMRELIRDIEHQMTLGGRTVEGTNMVSELTSRLNGVKSVQNARIAQEVARVRITDNMTKFNQGGNQQLLTKLYGAERVPVQLGGFLSKVPIIKRLFTNERIIARRLLQGEAVGKAALEQLGGHQTARFFAREIENHILAKRPIDAVHSYYSFRLTVSSMTPGIRYSTAMDAAFVNKLHRAIPATAILLGNTQHLNDPARMAMLSASAETNKATLAKINKENSQTYAAIRRSRGGSPSSSPSGSSRSLTGRVSGAVRGAASTVAGGATKAGQEIARQSSSLYASARSTASRAYDSASSVEYKKTAKKAVKKASSWWSGVSIRGMAKTLGKKLKSAADATAEAASSAGSTVAGAARRGASATASAAGSVKRRITGSSSSSAPETPKVKRTKEEVVEFSAVLQAASKANVQMNKYLEAGNLQKAFQQFHVQRNILFSGKDTKQYVIANDVVFLNYIHKVIPGSVNHIKTLAQLRNIAIIGKLPTRLAVNRSAMAEASRKSNLEIKAATKRHL